MTITFKALVNQTTVDKTKPLVNNADVYDNYGTTTPTAGDNPMSDIKDSTATSNDSTNTHVPDDPEGTVTGGDSSTPVNFSDRGLTLTVTGSTTAELPPTSATPATYTETIRNTGNNTENGLTFTISNPSTTDNITPQNVIYTPQGGAAVTLTPTNGVYTLPPLAPDATGTIKYDVVTTGANIGTSETNTITLIPADVTGTTTPTVTTVTNTTTVEGLKLVKTQTIDDNCDGVADNENEFTQANISRDPGQCVVYRITATNSMKTKALNNVVISDLASQWNTKATYVAGSIKDSANGATTAPGVTAISSPLTIATNGGTGWLQFAIKINQ